jgi:hypothetical protein
MEDADDKSTENKTDEFVEQGVQDGEDITSTSMTSPIAPARICASSVPKVSA